LQFSHIRLLGKWVENDPIGHKSPQQIPWKSMQNVIQRAH